MSVPIKKNLTQAERDALTGRWALVWASVYGAEWARGLYLAERNSPFGFDHHDHHDHSERASSMADRAVYQGRKFERDNG